MNKRIRAVQVCVGICVMLAACAPAATPMPTPRPPTATAVPNETVAPATFTPLAAATDTPVAEPSDTSTAVPSDTPLPTDTSPPTPTFTPQPTATPELPTEPDAAVGALLWPQLPCSGCHGAQAQGDFGPRLAGTGLSLDQVRATVRLGKGQMPSFSEGRVSDVDLGHVYAWLRSMAQPTPTPISRPSFPTQALSEMWFYVNEMRIRADFAKDLPERQAADEAGRLQIVKDYAGDGLNQVQVVLARANQALNEVPHENVKAIIREVIAETNAVADHFNRAQAASSYSAAWDQVAAAVTICRIDTLPKATQAVRDAGLVGQVRVRVVDQAGQPISAALVTVLTAHTPLAGRTDGSGRASFVNVAAVPALPVKAYIAGRVYHEFNFNVSPGGVAEGTIALPPLPGPNLAPAVADASIQPSAGPGNATVTFGLTATDPQGQLDLAEDQVFALNADLGLAYVLLNVGGNRYESHVTLPDLPAGLHTWSFFAVDHECNTSNIVDVRYRVE